MSYRWGTGCQVLSDGDEKGQRLASACLGLGQHIIPLSKEREEHEPHTHGVIAPVINGMLSAKHYLQGVVLTDILHLATMCAVEKLGCVRCAAAHHSS